MTKPKPKPSAWIGTVEDGVLASSRPTPPLPAAPLEPERPWDFDDGVVRGAWSWHVPNMHPAHVNALARLEAQERIAARAEREALAERVEARYNQGMMVAMADAAARGLAWSPTEPWRVWPSMEQRMAEAEMVEAAQDAANDRRALIDAGLLHLIDSDGRASASRSSAAVAGSPPGQPRPSATPLAARIRAFLRRTESATAAPPAKQRPKQRPANQPIIKR
jgi:hypothetical protein